MVLHIHDSSVILVTSRFHQGNDNLLLVDLTIHTLIFKDLLPVELITLLSFAQIKNFLVSLLVRCEAAHKVPDQLCNLTVRRVNKIKQGRELRLVCTESVSGHVCLLERALLGHFAHFLEVQSDIVLQEVLVDSTEVVVGASDVVELEESLQVDVAVLVIIVGFDDLGYAIV